MIGFQTFVKVVHSIPEFVRFSEVLPTAAGTTLEDLRAGRTHGRLRVNQELFEVVSVYFPVTFTPKPNDPYGITKEALVQSLR